MNFDIEQLEQLEALENQPGWKLVERFIKEEMDAIMVASFNAQDRSIQNGNVTVVESKASTIDQNHGAGKAYQRVLNVVRLARKRREENAKGR